LSWAKATREKETSRTKAKRGTLETRVFMAMLLETLNSLFLEGQNALPTYL
jgi:hypothetical protein